MTNQPPKELSTLFASDLANNKITATLKKYNKDSLFVALCAQDHLVVFFTDFSLIAIDETGDISRVFVINAKSTRALFSCEEARHLMRRLMTFGKKQAQISDSEQDELNAAIETIIFTQGIESLSGKKTIDDLLSVEQHHLDNQSNSAPNQTPNQTPDQTPDQTHKEQPKETRH